MRYFSAVNSGRRWRGLDAAGSCRNRRQQGAGLSDNATLELGVAYERRTEHRLPAFVVVNACLTGSIGQDFCDHFCRSLRSAQNFNEWHEQRHEQRNDVFLQKAHRRTDIAAPEAGSWINARLDSAEVQARSLTREHHHGRNIALL